MLDLYSIKFKTSINLNYAESLEKKLAKYKIDVQKEQRETKKECKVCFYLYRPRVAGQAFTKSNCVECKPTRTSFVFLAQTNLRFVFIAVQIEN